MNIIWSILYNNEINDEMKCYQHFKGAALFISQTLCNMFVFMLLLKHQFYRLSYDKSRRNMKNFQV